jgi:3-oxoacyl-[acyl-carrier protein] reductase
MADDAHVSIIGRSVVVTGGSKGIGKELALALSRAGANVVVTGRKRAELDIVECHEGRGTGLVKGVVADVRDAADCELVVRVAEQTFGKVDALVNNAGIALAGISESFNEAPPKFWTADQVAWRAILDTNVVGPFLMTQAAIPAMLDRNFGRIINVSSAPAVMRRPGWSPYGASKAALESLSITWAQELEGTGVTVNIVRPGGQVDTGIFPGAGVAPRPGFLMPSVMNDLVVWLVSDLSAKFNGSRFSGQLWDKLLPPVRAAERAMLPYPEQPFLF